ncbi:cytochrome c family protein [Neorhizobium sp. Rsf11]|uniref:Cytochrome c family protein n=2 Tax=Neorhizobium TaxID=1525371 RepID=A0ABV0LYB7_9HYPH|nr:cytochrome c family protein [Neorhizobium petrolearium]MCC2612470.1 cytochrome c family protein [Neorhizobium petrolearium]WGI67599.1 cytochrome c family protein [Neorhizobium petrolearium]
MNWKLAFTGVAAACLFVGVGTVLSPVSVAQDAQADARTLKPAASFQSIANEQERSVALFQEAGKVIQHPRCVNCHPATDRPLQGASMRPHQPPVLRGDGGMGLPGMQCTTCHGAENIPVVGQADTIKSIPGNPAWHLAPIEMAWEGKTLGQICQQIKDPARNGEMTMDELVEHMAHDELVGWGWAPGAGREPVPGTQAEFGELIDAWVKTGAACPAS